MSFLAFLKNPSPSSSVCFRKRGERTTLTFSFSAPQFFSAFLPNGLQKRGLRAVRDSKLSSCRRRRSCPSCFYFPLFQTDRIAGLSPLFSKLTGLQACPLFFVFKFGYRGSFAGLVPLKRYRRIWSVFYGTWSLRATIFPLARR